MDNQPHEPHGSILAAASEEFPRHSDGSAVVLADGAILLAWGKFRGRGDNARAHIAAVTSRDGGETWGEERTLVENEAGLNVLSPALERLADGGLGLLYSHRESTTNASRSFRRSDDEGRTWSAPTRLPQEDPYQTGCHDRLLVLASGRLVAALHCTDDWHAHHLHVRAAWSDDHGRTWGLSGPLALPRVSDSGESGCIEPDIAQRADGSLLMVIRTAMGTIFRAESRDEGQTWTGLRSLEVVAPVAPSRLVRLPGTADLLLLWNWTYDWRERLAGTRRPLAAAISTDGGDSWPRSRRKLLEDAPPYAYSYPSCLVVGDDVLLTYHLYHLTPSANAGDDRSLKVVRVPIAWFYA